MTAAEMMSDKKKTGVQAPARGVDRPAKHAVLQEEAPSRCGSPRLAAATGVGKARPAAAAAEDATRTQPPEQISRGDRALAQWQAVMPRLLLAWAWELALLVGVTVALLSQVRKHSALAGRAACS